MEIEEQQQASEWFRAMKGATIFDCNSAGAVASVLNCKNHSFFHGPSRTFNGRDVLCEDEYQLSSSGGDPNGPGSGLGGPD